MSLSDRKSTRLNSSHTVIYTLSLHDALPISINVVARLLAQEFRDLHFQFAEPPVALNQFLPDVLVRSEEHTSELQSHRDLHSFPTRRSSDLNKRGRPLAGSRIPRPPLSIRRAAGCTQPVPARCPC